MNRRVIRRWFVFALLFLAVLCLSTSGKEYKADYWVQQGNDFYNNGSYEVALDCYNKSIELDPQNVVSWNNKGNAFADMGRFNESVKCYDQAIKIDPQSEDAWFGKGNILLILDKYNESIKSYENAIKINPIYVVAWNNKGSALYYLGKYNESIQAYDKAIQIDPKWAKSWNNKGIVLGELGKYEEGIKCYDKAIEADPNYAMAFTNKGWALSNIGEYNESIEYHDKGIEITPSKPFDYGSSLNYLNRINSTLAKFYLSDGEKEATSILDSLGLRYVSTDYDMLYGKFPALAIMANRNPSEYQNITDLGNYLAVVLTKKMYYNTTLALLHFIDGSSLGHFRLICESHIILGQNPPTSSLKIFEYVPGALIKVSNAPGQKVVALLNMTSNQGRKFIYVNEGTSEVRVPYSTEKKSETYARTPYLVVSGNNSTNMRKQSINVTEDDVIHGRVIEVNLR